jgi:hypothetical protein
MALIAIAAIMGLGATALLNLQPILQFLFGGLPSFSSVARSATGLQ